MLEALERRVLLDGAFTGIVYNDINGNDTFDAGVDQRLGGIVVFADENDNGEVDDDERMVTTNANGAFSLLLPNGTHNVIIDPTTVPGNLTARENSGGFTVTVTDFGGDVVDVDPTSGNFGFTGLSIVRGNVFNDLNANGQRDGGEPDLAGFTVFLDTNANGVIDAGEFSATSAANGEYVIGGVDPGNYLVTLIPNAGFFQTSPDPLVTDTDLATGRYKLVVTADSEQGGFDFGVFQNGLITGKVFLDANASAALDANEVGLRDLVVYIDVDNDGVLNENLGDIVALTDADGNYTFTDLDPGEYVVRQIIPEGYTQTTPGTPGAPTVANPNPGEPEAITVTMESGLAATDSNFGLYELTLLTGTVFHDRDANGIQQDIGARPLIDAPGTVHIEEGLEGWTVFLDANDDNVLNDDETFVLTDANGFYQLPVFGENTSFKVVEQIKAPGQGERRWRQSSPDPVLLDEDDPDFDPDPLRFYLVELGGFESGQVFDDLIFGNFKLASFGGLVYEDLTGNGVFDPGTPINPGDPRVENRIIFIDLDGDGVRDFIEPWVRSTERLIELVIPDGGGPAEEVLRQEAGLYGFGDDFELLVEGEDGKIGESEGGTVGDLMPGHIIVREVIQPPIGQVFPGPVHNSQYSFTLLSDERLESVDFAEFRYTEVLGRVTGDTDRNGTFTSGEQGVPSIKVYVDLNGNGQDDPGEPFDLTDAAGDFRIVGAGVGALDVRYVVPNGWLNTGLEVRTRQLDSGDIVVNTNFYTDILRPEIDLFQVTLPNGTGVDIEKFDGGAGVDFTPGANVVVGDPSPQVSFAIRNNGLDDLHYTNIVMPSGFTLLAGQTSGTLAPSEQAVFTVAMSTTNLGSIAGVMQILSDDVDESVFDLQLFGQVEGLPPQISILLGQTEIPTGDPDANPPVPSTVVNFGSVDQNDNPIVRTFTVRNDAPNVTHLSLGNLVIPQGFTLLTPLPGSLNPGQSAQFQLQLNTTVAGVKGGEIRINSNDPNVKPFIFDVAGEVIGEPGQIEVRHGATVLVDGQTAPIDFGSVTEGQPGVVRTFTVRNTGSGLLELSMPTLPAGYSIVDPLKTELASGEADVLSIRLNSIEPGLKTGVVTIDSSDPDNSSFSFGIRGQVQEAPRPDLEVSLVSANIPLNMPLLPGDEIDATVRIANIGEARAQGLAFVNIYLSEDGAIDDSDLLLSRSDSITIDLFAGAQQFEMLSFDILSSALPGAFNILVELEVDVALAVAEKATANNLAMTAAEVKWLFGDVAGRGNVDLTVTDYLGREMTFSLSEGMGEVSGPMIDLVTLQGANSGKAKFEVSSDGAAVGRIEGGTFKQFILDETDIYDDVVIDWAKKIEFRDAIGTSNLFIGDGFSSIADRDKKQAVQLAFRDAWNFGIESDFGFKKLDGREWVNDLGMLQEYAFIGPWVGKMSIENNLTAHVDLFDSTSQKETVKKLDVGGLVEHSSIRLAGSLKKGSVGALLMSEVRVGIDDGVVGLPTDAADFDPLAFIKKFDVKGVDGRPEPSFVDSVIAAWEIGKVKLVEVDGGSGDGPFGIAAHESKKIQRQDSNDKISVPPAGIGGIVDQEGNYQVFKV